jgi:hypothetical protein
MLLEVLFIVVILSISWFQPENLLFTNISHHSFLSPGCILIMKKGRKHHAHDPFRHEEGRPDQDGLPATVLLFVFLFLELLKKLLALLET